VVTDHTHDGQAEPSPTDGIANDGVADDGEIRRELWPTTDAVGAGKEPERGREAIRADDLGLGAQPLGHQAHRDCGTDGVGIGVLVADGGDAAGIAHGLRDQADIGGVLRGEGQTYLRLVRSR